jgi:hypothetical protein
VPAFTYQATDCHVVCTVVDYEGISLVRGPEVLVGANSPATQSSPLKIWLFSMRKSVPETSKPVLNTQEILILRSAIVSVPSLKDVRVPMSTDLSLGT